MEPAVQPQIAPARQPGMFVASVVFALGLASGILSAWAGGATAGPYFGGIALVTLFLPHLVLCHGGLGRRALAVAAGAGGIAIVWLLADRQASLAQRLGCVLVLASYALALAGAAMAARRAGLSPGAAGALVVLLGCLWLTWPVWLSPWLEGSSGEAVAGALVPVHPLFAIGAVLPERGIWTQQAALMYGLTNLGQHLRYALPAHAWPAVVFHTLLGIAAGAAGRRARLPRRANGDRKGPAPS